MRWIIIGFALAVCAIKPGELQAGIYSTSGPQMGPAASTGEIRPVSSSTFRDQLAELFTVGIPVPVSLARTRYLKESSELESKIRSGRATPNEQLNLGADLIRLGRAPEAIDVLTRAAALERRNFMLLANLGTAHQLDGHWARAIDYLEQARDSWPQEHSGMTPQQLKWYRRAEDYQMKLIRLRAHEALRQPAGLQKPADTVDDLFGVRFIGESGKYEAARLAASERSKLPADAVAIVQQLLIWLPADARLYWLLGELLNAQGDVASAAIIFDECLWTRRYDAVQLREHRQVVQEANAKASEVIGDFEPPPPEAPLGWHLDRRLIMTGGALAGLLLAVLAYLQVREMRRAGARQGSGVRDQGSRMESEQ
jgi:tetratricopeptide (TPR) repeat protein